MRRILLSLWLLCLVSLGLNAQILMPREDGAEKVETIAVEKFFYDSGGPSGNQATQRVNAITFVPKPGEMIEITFEEVQLSAATLYFYDGKVPLVKIPAADEDEDDEYQKPSVPARYSYTGNKMEPKVIRSQSPDGKLTVVFVNANGIGKGWVAKVKSSPRTADDPKAPEEPKDVVKIGRTHRTVEVGDTPLNFYDDGGKEGKITENFEGSITFIPKTAGRRVRITFNKLDLFNTNPLRNDQLHIYNGKEAKAEKHLRTLLSDKTPVVLLSASEDGSLTVTLKSTTGVTKSGFEAVVTEFVPQAMALNGIKQTQLESNKPVMAGAKKQEILEVNIQAKDVLQPLTATSFTFSTEGSTEGVLSAAELWTKDRGVMAPARKLGEVTSIGKTCTVTLSSPYTLMDGDNAFVLYYDIAETAQTGGQVDASLVSVLLSGKEEKPSETAVPGSRPIQNIIHSSEGHNTYKIYGEWKFLPTMTFNKYAGGRVDQKTTLLPSKSGEVVELDFEYFKVYYGKASYQPKAKFIVYNGATASGAPLWSANLGNHDVGPKVLRSTSADGALTIVFNPNETSRSYTEKGWSASVRSITPKSMTLAKAIGFQASTEAIPTGSVKQAILGLELQTEGFLNPLTLDKLSINLKGSEGHLARVALYATADKREFSANDLVAEASAPLGSTITLTPNESRQLTEGTSYYYIAYDPKSDAPAGITYDASFTELIVSGATHVITTPDPDGVRKSRSQHIFQGGKDETVQVTSPITFYDAGGVDRKAPNGTANGSVRFVPKAGEVIRCRVVSAGLTRTQHLRFYSGQSTDAKDQLLDVSGSDQQYPTIVSLADDGSVTVQYTKGYGESDWEIEIESIVPQPLSIASVTTEVASEAKLLAGAKNEPFLHITLKVEGDKGALEVTGFELAGLTEASKKALVKRCLYSSGADASLTTTKLFASTEDASATTFTGSETFIKPGSYHYWLTGDIATSVAAGTEVAMSLKQVRSKDKPAVAPTDSKEAKREVKAGMHGEYLVGASSAAKYKSLKDATDALSAAGVDGPVTLLLESGVYTDMVSIPAIDGLSSTNTLTIRSQSGKRSDVVFDIKPYKTVGEDKPGHFTVDGADYLTLEALTIKGYDKKAPAVVLVRNKSEHVTIRDCYLWAPLALDYLTGNIAVLKTSAKNEPYQNNDYLTLVSSTVEGGYQGAYIDGTGHIALPKQKGAHLKDNVFIGQGSVGIYATLEHDALYEGNTIYGRGEVANPYKALDITLMGNTVIRNNKVEVRGLQGKRRDINALHLRHTRSTSDTPSGRNLIYNNELRITADNGADVAYGIVFSDPNLEDLDILHNSVSITNPTAKQSSAPLAIIGRGSNVAKSVNIRNNLFQNHAGGYVYYMQKEAFKTGITFSHNATFSSGTHYAKVGENVTRDKWKELTGDATSIVEDVQFFDEESSLLPRAVGSLRFAPRQAEVTHDITGAERPSSLVTAGAYEVTEHDTPALASGYPKVSEVGVTTAKLLVKATDFGKLLYKVLPSTAAAPTLDELKASTDKLTFSKNTEQGKTLTGLTSETEYKLYGLLLGLNGVYTDAFTPIAFTTTHVPTAVSTFEAVAKGTENFDDGTAHFDGFTVEEVPAGAKAGSKHIAKVNSPAEVTITNSRGNLLLDGFWLKSDKSVILKTKDKDGAEGKSKTLEATGEEWLYINLRELGKLHSLSLTTLGEAYIDDFSGTPAPLVLDDSEESAMSGEVKTLSITPKGGVLPYSYLWRDALGKELSREATLRVKATHTQLYGVEVRDAWNQVVSAHKTLKVSGESAMATFDDLSLAPESHWTGDNTKGDEAYETTFYSGSYGFANTYIKKWSSWGGYAYSNRTSTNFATWDPDQYNSAVGHGVAGSKNYGIAYLLGGSTKISVTHAPKAILSGMYVTNTAWVKHVTEHGTGIGPDANTPFKKGDYYKITAVSNDDETKKIDFYLVDFRSDNPADHYVIDSWQWLDLSALGEVSSIRFNAAGTRANQFGSTIPFYFALDNVGGKVMEEKSSSITVRPGSTESFDLAKLFASTSLPKKAGATTTYALVEAPEAILATASVVDGKLQVVGKVKGETNLLVKATARGASVYLRVPLVLGEPRPVDPTLSITDLRVLPNPATEYITLTAEGKVEIYALSGALVYRTTNYTRGSRISISDYAPGVYLVRAGGSTQRFIKK